MPFTLLLTEIDLQDLTSQSKKVAQLEKRLFDLQEQEQSNTMLLESLVEHLEHKPVEPPSVSYKGCERIDYEGIQLITESKIAFYLLTDLP